MNPLNRPKLEIPKTRLEKILDWIGAVVFAAWIIYLITVWGDLPAKVPGHYDGTGEVTRWGTNWELLLLPVIAGFLAVFLSFLEKHPEWHNYMNLTEDNIVFQYKNSRMMLNVMKNVTTAVFAYVSWKTVQVALGEAESMGIWFLPVFLTALLGPMIFFVIRSVRHK